MKKIMVILTLLFFIIVSPANADEKKSRAEVSFTEDYIDDTVTSSEISNSSIENQGGNNQSLLPKTNENKSDFSWVGYILVGIVIYFIKKQRNDSKMKWDLVDIDPI